MYEGRRVNVKVTRAKRF